MIDIKNLGLLLLQVRHDVPWESSWNHLIQIKLQDVEVLIRAVFATATKVTARNTFAGVNFINSTQKLQMLNLYNNQIYVSKLAQCSALCSPNILARWRRNVDKTLEETETRKTSVSNIQFALHIWFAAESFLATKQNQLFLHYWVHYV